MAIDEGLRSRLEALNRGPVPEPPCTVPQAVSAAVRATASAGPPRKQAPHPAPSAQPAPAWRSGLVRPIAGLLRRGDSEATDAGEHWRVQLPLDAIWPGGEELVARRRELLASRPPAQPADGEPAEWPAAFPRGVLFLDLETCGFSGSALFLAGLLRETEGRLAVELLLARDYSEEAAVLASLWRRLGECTSIVTFNGKSFDWPMVVDRTRRHRLPMGGRPGSQAECGDGPLRSASPPDAAQHGQA
ncbi:MAG TPA: ribonuclease H-like domain-containing protein, partial [Lacipirellulaceae bacterium]|nr:ribonuclease H-like domain-containing protein [Lacipirellulaceae bacterium]